MKYNVQIIENIESVLPVYDSNLILDTSFSNQNKIIDKKIIDCEIGEIESVTELEQLLFDEDFFATFDENDKVNAGDLNDLDLGPIDDATEGKEQLLIHIRKERDYYFMKKCKLRYKLINNRMPCEICGFSFKDTYPGIGDDYIEGHHIIPIAELKPDTKISYKDILMVCSNCHRIIHRRTRCLTKEEIMRLVNKSR